LLQPGYAGCVGTAVWQGARSVVPLELLPKPPERENKGLTWPHWPLKLRTSTSHEEGGERDWAIGTKAFLGDNGWVTGVQTVRLEWRQEADGRWTMQELSGSDAVIPAERVLLALGFVHPIYEGMLAQLGVALDAQGNVHANTDTYQTSRNQVFVAGDMRRGQSLVVWAIREGRQCARAVDEFLMGGSDLAG
jgi:glutamate synthase (NADPH/NADH) small chain